MLLTEQQKDMLDNPAKYMRNENITNSVSRNTTDEDLFNQMDKDLQGMGYNLAPKREKTIKEVLTEDDPDRAKQYEKMGPIQIYEGAKREAFEFSGKYDNVILRPSQIIAQENFKRKQDEINQKRAERNKRVNEGTATFNERVDAFFDRVAQSNIKDSETRFSQNAYNQNVGAPNTRTRIAGVSRTGEIIYDNVDLTKKIGFLESFRTSLPEGTAVGSFAKGFDDKKIREIKQKMIEDKPIYKDELDFINQHYEAEKEKQIRGYSIGGKIGEGLGKSLGFSADFIVGGAALKGLGVGALAENAGLKTYLGAKELGATTGIAKGLAKTAELGTNGILGSAVMTAVNTPLRLFPEYQERMLGNEAKLTDSGNMIFQESSEKPSTALMKSLGGLYIAYLTELSGGEALRGIANALAKPTGNIVGGAIGRLLSKNPALNNFMSKSTTELSKRYEALRGLPIVGKSTGWIKDTVHFDGFLEEMGEEALEDVLRLTFGIDNEERSFDNYVKAIFKTPEEWAVIAGTIVLQGAGLSAAGYAVAKNMAEAGADAEEISDVLINSTEGQKKQLLNEQIKEGIVAVPDAIDNNEINKNIVKANLENLSDKELEVELEKQEIEEKTYNTLLKGKVSEDVAVANSKLMGQFFKNFGSKDEASRKKFDEWINKLDVQYDVPVEQTASMFQGANVAGVNDNSEIENAKREWEEKGVESKYFRQWFGDSKVVDESGKPLVVYHGSPNEFEIFDSNKNLYGEVSKGFNFFTNKKSAYQNSAKDYADFAGTDGFRRNGKVYETYLSIQNPLHIQYTSNGMSVYNGEKRYSTPVEYYDYNYKQIQEEFRNGNYDGIIIENTDKNDDDSIIYLVPNSNQIKSVNNQGTFDSSNPNIYYQKGNNHLRAFNKAFNKIKTILTKKKIKDLAKQFDFFNLLSNELKFAQDYYIESLPNGEAYPTTKGRHDSPIIYINFEAIGDDFVRFVQVLAHEAEHARQEKEFNKIYAKKKKSKKDWEIIGKYNFCTKANEARREYYDEHKEIIDKILNDLSKFKTEYQAQNYISGLDPTSLEIYNEYNKLYSEYFNQANEIKAREAGENARRKIENINSGILAKAQNNYAVFKRRYIGTVARNGVQRKQGTEQGTNGQDSEEINNSIRTFFQSAQNFDVNSYIENNFGDSVENITDGIRGDIQNILDENDISAEEFNIDDIRIYGSYSTGQNRNTSDLDFLVEYSGTMREDDAFNMFSDAGLKLTDVNGREINVDINPIRKDKSGTIVQFLERNKNYKKNIAKTFFEEGDDEKRIAGYTYPEVMEKMTSLYEEIGTLSDNDPKLSELMAKVHILEDAFNVAENPDNYEENEASDIMLNAYYIMNNQELPSEIIEEDRQSLRSYNDLKEIHNEKREQAEREYYGYFTEGQDKNVITIMANSDASTALHELGHLFLNGLNELASVNEEAREQLNAFNKWLGYAGGEYTIAQQEKFARSFEAYLYKGKAPNSKLKTVFENFKEWLKSVYNYIVNIPDADISEEVQELFDKMFADDGYYQEQRQANELLKRVKELSKKEKTRKVEVRSDKELDDYAKRHKEASYQILSEATGKSVKYLKSIFESDSDSLALAKKRDAIRLNLDSVEDKITISGGIREEWKEFYSDTGVNEDTDEVQGDFKLVEKALDTIINKSYGSVNFENELDERASYYEKAINEADLQYKLLLKEYEKGNRNVALSAFYDWVEGLDREIKGDYENKFIYDTRLIERNENLNKFDMAKRKILAGAMELENQYGINSNEKYQELVKIVMKNLNFLQPNDKAKLTANVLDISSTSMLMARIDEIMDIAKTMEDVQLRRNLERDIHAELQKTKNVKKNGRTVGRYDYKSNKLFEELRELDKLTPEKANDLRLEMSKFISAEDNGLSYKDKLINKFLSYKADGRTYADTELMKELYDEIMKIKFIGKSAKSELDLMEKLDETKDIDELIKIVEKKNKAGVFTKNYVSWVGNLESTINAIFNKKIKEKYASEILYAETQAQAWQYKVKAKFENEVAKIYNLPSWLWDKKIIEYLGQKFTYPEIRRKYDEKGELVKTRNIDRELTKMDIIQAYIWSKNETLEKRLINQFGENTLESMFDELSIQDVKLAELMMETAQSFYNMVNKAFINKYGLDLPKVSCYFPSTPERGSEVDLYNDYSSKSLNNSFTKQRAQSETVPMDFHNPVAILYNHIEGVSKFAFMSDALDKANLRFKDNDLKRVIINKFGKDVYSTLEQALMNVTYKKEAPVFNGMSKILDNITGNWIQANVAIKPIVGLKQLLSANNYAVDMPYWDWQKGFIKALANPKETIDYMMKIPYLKARYEGNFSNEFLKAQIENSAFALSKKLKDLCTVFVKMGDIGAIIFGGKPYIDYQISQGLSEEEAIKQFILSTNRSQQSSAVSSLSNFQVEMTRNPIGKLFIAFKNSPQQYVRMCGDAIISATNGDISKAKAAKMLFQFGYLQPFLYALATSGSLLRWMFAGDDDDLIKDLSVSIFNIGSDALPLVGDIYKYIINKVLYKEKNLPATTPLLGDIEKEINRISKEDADLSDYLEAIGYLGLHVGLGYNSKAIGNMFSGVGDIATGEPVKGTMKVLGYTKKRAEHISGED